MRRMLPLLALLVSGCARQAPPPSEGQYVVHAIAHASAFDAIHGAGDTWHATKATVVGAEVVTPAWVAAPRYDSRQLRAGRATWWLADEPSSVTDEEATWRIVR